MVRNTVVLLLILVLPGLIFVPERGVAMQRFGHALNPKTYLSPSGAYQVRVDPGDREGQGKASYRITHSTKEVWSGTFSLYYGCPACLWHTALSGPVVAC